ncbi:MAG: SDR family oxidoreductase [Acidimicrobiia bacterium]
MGLLDGKVAIVTGAGRGIGRSHALLLASEGAKIVVNDLGGGREGDGADATPAEQVASEIVAAGGAAVANHENIATWPGAEALINQAVSAFGKLDILVNNAGILRDGMSFNLTEEEWDSVITVHLKGHFAPSHFAARYWREQAKSGEVTSGRIINTSSESGLFGNAGQANYAAAKAGIASMTIVMARELAKYGVTVNAIAPRARTRMTETIPGAADFMVAKEGEFDQWSPDNISPIIGFLASDAAADISGQTFIVWADHVYSTTGWRILNDVAKGDRWTVSELVEKKGDLFAGGSSEIPPMSF